MDRRRKKKDKDVLAERTRFYEELDSSKLSVAETVRRMRRITGLTQPEYAKLVGVAPRALIDIERGTANPTLETLNKIGRPFGLEVALRRRPPDAAGQFDAW